LVGFVGLVTTLTKGVLLGAALVVLAPPKIVRNNYTIEPT